MNTKHCYSLLAGCLAALLTTASQAQHPVERPPGLPELSVVVDHGGKPARPYYVAINGAGVDEDEGYSTQLSNQARPNQRFSENDMLPIESEILTPGAVEARQIELPGGFTPIFLVGDDELSREWLIQRADILREMNAVGLVVQVQSEQGLNSLRNEAQGLELRPVSGDGLAERLGLQHYPVLISQRGIEQ